MDTHPTTTLERADFFNQMAFKGSIGLALCLPEIIEKQSWTELGYENFVDYYTLHLKRDKGTMSKLKAVGEFATKNSFNVETLEGATVSTLYSSITKNKDKDPEYILASAQELTVRQIEDNKRDQDFKEHEHMPGEERWAKCTCTNEKGEVCDKFFKV